jgi:hypothetical protein
MKQRFLALIPALAGLSGGTTPPGGETTLLETGYRQMYNLEFDDAHRTFQQWKARHPEDPLGPASDAAAWLFGEFDRLHILQSEFFVHDRHFITDHKLTPDPAVKRSFLDALAASRTLAARAPRDANSLFASMMADGLESDYLALIEKRYAASLSRMKAARAAAEKLLAANPEHYDAWIAVGVENYMLSVKPRAVRWLLRLAGAQTDRGLGVEKLRLTAERGRYLGPFARLLLAVAALRERDTGQARELLEGLAREYPRNPLYREELARLESPGPGGSSR